METLTIQLTNPKALSLIENLEALNLISIKRQPTWVQNWKNISENLPNTNEISEAEILNEISSYRNSN